MTGFIMLPEDRNVFQCSGEAGTYLIKINDESNNALSDTDPYEVQLTCNPNALELNQIYEEASPIPIDTCFEDNIYGDNHTYDVVQ